MAGDKGSKRLATLLALVGTAVSVLTLYYARQDAKEKAAHDRPIIEITAASLLSFSGDRPPQEYNLQLAILNRGTQIASEVTLEQQNIPASSFQPLNRVIALGDIAPSQNVQQPWSVTTTPLKVNRIVRLEGVFRYKNRVDTGWKFNEPFCLEAATFLAPTTRHELLPPNVYENVYSNPIQMKHCVPSAK